VAACVLRVCCLPCRAVFVLMGWAELRAGWLAGLPAAARTAVLCSAVSAVQRCTVRRSVMVCAVLSVQAARRRLPMLSVCITLARTPAHPTATVGRPIDNCFFSC
jgi:hypothetical protein